jgi:peptidoglycan/LPS O-acetylase OafA/YrhL
VTRVSRKPLELFLAVLFGILALTAWVQVVSTGVGGWHEPPALPVLHFAIGAAGAAASWGSWRRSRWASIAAAAYGVLTGALLLILRPLLSLPDQARAGLWTGAAAVVVFSMLCAAYLRSQSRLSSGR